MMLAQITELFKRIEKLEKDSKETDDIANCQNETISILCTKVNNLKKELSSCIDVKLLYSDRQARETWQQGCEAMISDLCKRVADMDLMIKEKFLCVDNSHAEENEKKLALPSISQLNKIVNGHIYSKVIKEGDRYILKTQNFPFEEDKVNQPSQKHLEKKLREKKEKIKQLTEKNIELEHKITELLVACQTSMKEINSLQFKLKNCCCPNQIRTWAGAMECKS